MQDQTAVLFGGSGFIGSNLARYLLDRGMCSRVILADIKEPDTKRFGYFLDEPLRESKVEYVFCDVRKPQSFANLPESDVGMIFNLAALHREPGHEPREYFETNLPGAENVCAWADRVGCNRIVFTSSIASCGSFKDARTEESTPCPESAYGSSKLVAEKIHLAWQQEDPAQRRLVVVRPGVVFGPEEGGNVTRMVRAVLGRYFLYMGNRRIRKACIYIKELCHSIFWALDRVDNHENGWLLYHATMKTSPSLDEYVQAICKVAGVNRLVPSVPYSLLYAVASVMDLVARPLGIRHPFSPVRIRKLVHSRNIRPKFLIEKGYGYQYSLQSAFEDWKSEMPTDWE